ncbi:putative transposase, Ptta/En/Spm, plant [Helianthus annuus]|uniref:Transposase, Ptta/En/Spm, plant n=2 Tax=Helianthus annuus TaxID=4232 RepID=A0A9K3H606_HELAN|nr:putative transposase, Ptta/En/Spm, plant [Helianthus annuus]
MANRAKKKMVQVTGKKSYARVREELKASKGQDPSRLEMFRAYYPKMELPKIWKLQMQL